MAPDPDGTVDASHRLRLGVVMLSVLVGLLFGFVVVGAASIGLFFVPFFLAGLVVLILCRPGKELFGFGIGIGMVLLFIAYLHRNEHSGCVYHGEAYSCTQGGPLLTATPWLVAGLAFVAAFLFALVLSTYLASRGDKPPPRLEARR